MKISYVAEFDVTDVTQRSGLGKYISQELLAHNHTLDYVHNFHRRPSLTDLFKFLYYKLKKERYMYVRDLGYAAYLSDIVSKKYMRDSDLIFSLSSTPLAYLETKKPLVLYTDATFDNMINFYFHNLCDETIRNGNILEKKALNSCDLIIYPSQWAAQSAIEKYNIDSNKIHIVPRGANINCDRSILDIKNCVHKKDKETCKLLFVGVDWDRKGGEKALDIARALNEAKIKTELHVVGLKKIPRNNLPDFVINHGFLNKSSQTDTQKLNKLYNESHFFVLPTKADAFGIVFCEANSFGLPVITHNVGGISSVIQNNINGKAFNIDSPINDFVNFIAMYFKDKKLYEELCINSFEKFKTELNWNVSMNKINNLMQTII